jgi:Zn-dependent M28 family amino/carboxypeptidase
MIRMPGTSFQGTLPPLTAEQREAVEALRADVEQLAGRIGERNHRHRAALRMAAEHVERRMASTGLGPRRQSTGASGHDFDNLELEVAGAERPHEIVVVGAHYDSVLGSPGANDNGTGVAALLWLAARFADRRLPRTLRFVAFVNEEPPHFQTDAMGSLVYARRCQQRGENVVAMLSLETLGCYSDAPGSQAYPPPLGAFYPSEGNFVAFVANRGSRELVRQVIEEFRKSASFPSEGASLPAWVPGVGWSDQWAFWQAGYPGVMVTDTAPFRYPHYHSHRDTPDQVDYERLARVVTGLSAVVQALASARG